MMKTTVRFDVHIYDPAANHSHSEDCWCEPVNAYWMKDNNGKMLHVLEHNDVKVNEGPLYTMWIDTALDGAFGHYPPGKD